MGTWGEYKDELSDMFNQVYLLRRSPSEALARGAARVAESWAWHKRSLERHAKRDPGASAAAVP
jgi:hypothetical protein